MSMALSRSNVSCPAARKMSLRGIAGNFSNFWNPGSLLIPCVRRAMGACACSRGERTLYMQVQARSLVVSVEYIRACACTVFGSDCLRASLD